MQEQNTDKEPDANPMRTTRKTKETRRTTTRFRPLYALTLLTGVLPLAARADVPKQGPSVATTISTGRSVTLTDRLTPEQPTLFVFLKTSSTLERAFLTQLEADAGDTVGLRVIELKTGMEPIAKQYAITETPTALVYDRRGRLTGRSSQADEIRAALQKARSVMRIDWAADDDPRLAESTRLIGRPPGTGILRTMTQKPEYLKYISELSGMSHFTDQYLTHTQKEMIATYVSALNHCKY